jgi:hypothetical protein
MHRAPPVSRLRFGPGPAYFVLGNSLIIGNKPLPSAHAISGERTILGF